MDSNSTHLRIVMSRFGLSSRDLADMLNIHYSLVSKWLNNKRPLKSNSFHLKKLVEVLLSLDAPSQLSTLKIVLQEAYPESDLSGKEKVAVYLSRYLSSDTSRPDEQQALENIEIGHVHARAKLDIYRKNAGRREALLRLLDTAISLSPGQELFLFSREDPSWHMDKEEFRAKWLEKHRSVLQHGNRVTMVHTVDREAPHLLHTISQWMPLHLTGKTTAYYHPEYSNSIFKPSISLLRGHAALIGMTADGFSDEFLTYYTQDESLLKQLESIFDALLSECLPIFEKLGDGNISQKMLEAAQRDQTSYNISSLPLSLSLDCESFCELLRGNGVTGMQYEQCADYFKRHKENLMRTLQQSSVNQMMVLSTIEEAVKTGTSTSEFNWIVGGNLLISPAHYKKGVRGLISLLNSSSNFHLALIGEHPLPHVCDVSLMIRENTIAVANSRVEGTPCPLVMREPTIVRTFFQYFERYKSSIPRIQRDKESVIHRLRQLLG